MDTKEILSHCDHTLLKTTSTWEQIKAVCDDGMKYKTASVCIPPSFVKRAKDYVGEGLKICTVIGFPNGYNTTAAKLFETQDAIRNGADEIDMVINLGDVKDKHFDAVRNEIKTLKEACGDKVLKVIIETCDLTDSEKIEMCRLITEAGADFIKTSTGFSSSGAKREDIVLFKEHVGNNVKMKAAGGIKTLADAEDFIKLGCERLGTSTVVRIAKESEKNG